MKGGGIAEFRLASAALEKVDVEGFRVGADPLAVETLILEV